MGWPTRISRSALGPTREDRKPVTIPSQSVSAAEYNLLFWQVAGMNLLSSQASVLVTNDGATATLIGAGEAWDPDELVDPTVQRISQGIVDITYPATADDELWNEVTIALLAVDRVVIQKVGAGGAGTNLTGRGKPTAPNVVRIEIRDDAGALQDADFFASFF